MNLLKHKGPVRTDMHCHHCSKTFIAELDYSVDGNHVVECPHCGHEHCRGIKDGKVTEDRWDGRNGGTIRVKPDRVWKSSDGGRASSTASAYIRNRWLERGAI